MASRCYALSALVAEALAVRDALRLVRSMNLQHVVFELDNASIIDASRGTKEFREIQNIIHDIIFIKTSFSSCGFTWVKRTGNKVAHQIAALAKSNMLQGNWVMNLPESLQKVILEDARMTEIQNQRREERR